MNTPEATAARPVPELSVIVPTLDEAENIGALIDRLLCLPDLGERLEVLVADDGSRDGTIDEVKARSGDQRVRLLRRSGRPDLTASVLEAARAARAPICVVMDADGSHPVDALPRLVQPLTDGVADVVVGSRHVRGGSIPDWPMHRRLASRAAAWLAWPFTRVRDPMSGFFATTRDRLTSLTPLEAGYKILLEVLVRTRPAARVCEVPIEFRDRDAGSSKMTARVQWLFVRRLAALGGARLTLGNLSRFSLVGLTGLAVDLFVFWLMQSMGFGLASAHFTAFLAATVNNYLLNARWSFAENFGPDRPAVSRYGAFLVVALLALALRGGVLATLVGQFGLAANWAILPAVAMTAAVNYLGAIFYVFPALDAERNPDIRWRMAAVGLIGCSLAIRALYMGQAELMFDEMYYWVYTLHPALSYLDHPPLTAWLIGLSSALLGDDAFGVRAPALVLSLATLTFAYLYARDTFDKTRGLVAAMLVAVVPGWLASGLLMTTEAAAVPAWLAALWFLRRALIADDGRAWLGAGVAIGLGALAKYTIVLLGPAVLVWMLLDRPSRAWLGRPQPWLAAIVALVLFSPVLIWNSTHDWASFSFQTLRRIQEESEFTTWLLPLQTTVMLAPLAGLVAIWLLGPAASRLCPDPRQRRFMRVMTLVPLAVLAAFGFGTEIKFHWVVPMWLGMLPLIAASVLPPPGALPGRLLAGVARLWPAILPLSLVIAGLGLHYLSLGLPGLAWHPNRLGYMGWPEIAREVDRIERSVEVETGKRPIVVGMDKWGIAAALTFHDTDGRIDNITARNLVGLSGSQWERWFDPATDPERPLILVSHETKQITKSWLDRAVHGLGPVHHLMLERNGKPIQNLYYRVASGFRPEQLRYPGHIPQ